MVQVDEEVLPARLFAPRQFEAGDKLPPNEVMRQRYRADLDPILQSCRLGTPDPLANRSVL